MILGEEKLCDGTAVACGEKLLRDIGGRGWRTIFATAQPSPTEKKLLRDADTADYGEGPAS
ncbi:MAG: hypothetical protein IJM04_13260 [Prevotella sp.]|nr:hypothetical protein [Prevotella sp.]